LRQCRISIIPAAAELDFQQRIDKPKIASRRSFTLATFVQDDGNKSSLFLILSGKQKRI
jgi:hypothetical protein